MRKKKCVTERSAGGVQHSQSCTSQPDSSSPENRRTDLCYHSIRRLLFVGSPHAGKTAVGLLTIPLEVLNCVSPRCFEPWECEADIFAPTLIRLSGSDGTGKKTHIVFFYFSAGVIKISDLKLLWKLFYWLLR